MANLQVATFNAKGLNIHEKQNFLCCKGTNNLLSGEMSIRGPCLIIKNIILISISPTILIPDLVG